MDEMGGRNLVMADPLQQDGKRPFSPPFLAGCFHMGNNQSRTHRVVAVPGSGAVCAYGRRNLLSRIHRTDRRGRFDFWSRGTGPGFPRLVAAAKKTEKVIHRKVCRKADALPEGAGKNGCSASLKKVSAGDYRVRWEHLLPAPLAGGRDRSDLVGFSLDGDLLTIEGTRDLSAGTDNPKRGKLNAENASRRQSGGFEPVFWISRWSRGNLEGACYVLILKMSNQRRYPMIQLILALAIFASSHADEALIGTWILESEDQIPVVVTVQLQEDGDLYLVSMFDAVSVLNVEEMDIGDYPEAEESLRELLTGKTINLSISGAWETRGDSLYATYHEAEVAGWDEAEVVGWDEIVDEVMEIVTPNIEDRLEGTEEDVSDVVATFRGILQSWFSVDKVAPLGDGVSSAGGVEGDELTLGGDGPRPEVYRRVSETAVRPLSWGEVKQQR